MKYTVLRKTSMSHFPDVLQYIEKENGDIKFVSRPRAILFHRLNVIVDKFFETKWRKQRNALPRTFKYEILSEQEYYIRNVMIT